MSVSKPRFGAAGFMLYSVEQSWWQTTHDGPLSVLLNTVLIDTFPLWVEPRHEITTRAAIAPFTLET